MNDTKNKILLQNKYIHKNLSKLTTCAINIRKQKNLKQVSTPIVNNILLNNFDNGSDMNAVVCLFDTLFLRSKKNGLYRLSVHVSKWVKQFERIDIESSSGYVYFSDILNGVKVIIKTPKHPDDYDDLIREYFIGVTEINKLRYTVPNFVYTFGAFLSPPDRKSPSIREIKREKDFIPFIIFEKIPGKNIQELLESDKLTFPQYLGMFVQILIAMEVAQRSILFCHYDFHTSNLMCRTINTNCKYTVPLDDNIYEITASEYLPVIIDFGLSTVCHKNNIVGSYTFPEHGMMPYMLQGVDMYKFLFYSCYFSRGNLQRQIMNLLTFYGKDDPYKLLIHGDNGFDSAQKEYVAKASYSKVATKTPLEFLDWVLKIPEYKQILSKYIKKKERTIYIPLRFSTTIQTYDNIFQRSERGRQKAIELVNNCIGTDSSYIMSKYSMYVLKGYNSKLTSSILTIDTKTLKKKMDKKWKSMVQNDRVMLFNYQELKLPDVKKIRNYSRRILNIKINSKKSRKSISRLINTFFQNVVFFDEIIPYLQFVYTIREIGATKLFNNFLTNFISSPHYKIYTQNFALINKTYRWCDSLISGIV